MRERTEFTGKIKITAWLRSDGRCENCTAKLFTGNAHYDHRVPDAMGGEATLANCQVLCRACHSVKTTKGDVPAIAKAKRRERRNAGIRKPRTITRWRRFSGEAVIAPRER